MNLSGAECIVAAVIVMATLPGFVFPKNKGVFVVEYAFLTLLVVFYDSLESDLYFYSHEYDAKRLSASIFEKGYEYLGILFKNMGIPFEIFHILVAAASMFVFAYVIVRLSPKPALCASLMYGFATFEYAWQLKSLTASAAIVYAAYYFFKDVHSRKRRMVFILLILTAAEFHFSSILFLPVTLISMGNKKRVYKWVMAAFLIFVALFFPLTGLARYMIPAFSTYINPLSAKTVFFSVLWHISGIAIMKLAYDAYVKKRGYGGRAAIGVMTDAQIALVECIFLSSFCLLLCVPLYYFTNVTSRVIRTWCIYFYIAISFIKRRRGFLNRENTIQLLLVAYAIFSFLAYHVWFTHNKLLVKNFIDGNLLLRQFLGL